MVRVKYTAKEDVCFGARRMTIELLRDWGSASRRDARRYRHRSPRDALFHSAQARAFFRAAAYLTAELKNDEKKLILKKLRKR